MGADRAMSESVSAVMSSAVARRWAVLRREFHLGERGSLRAHLIQGASGSFALNVASRLLGLAIGVLLARALGASAFGIYAYAFAWITLLKVPTTLGLPALVTREVTVYHARRNWGSLRGLLTRANQAVLGLSLLLVVLAGGASWLLADRFENPQALTTFWLALALLPLFGLDTLRGAALRGLHRVLLGQASGAVVRPALFLVMIGGIILVGDGSLTPGLAMGLQIVAVGCAFALGAVWLLRNLPPEVRGAAPVYESRAWAGSALPFLFIGGLNVVNGQTDIIMLGFFGTSADVGVYRVVCIGAGLVIFAMSAANVVLGPSIARLHAEGNRTRLQRVLTRSARMIVLYALPVALTLILFGGWLLAGIFGPDYAAGASALAILAAGQLLNAATGSVGVLLNMTGHERDAAKGAAAAAFLNVVLNAVLIPLWGIEGAALASAASLITWNILLAVLVRRRLGLHSTALGPLEFRRMSPTRIAHR